MDTEGRKAMLSLKVMVGDRNGRGINTQALATANARIYYQVGAQ